MFSDASTPKRILAVASSGGHWQQLMRLAPALAQHEVTFATTRQSELNDQALPGDILPEASRSNPLGFLRLAWSAAKIVTRQRPELVITTGAAPGLVVLCAARLVGAQTIWIDSVANVERVSMSGNIAGLLADRWLTQWAHLARREGPEYLGAVL